MTRDECLYAIVDRLAEGPTTADELAVLVHKHPRTIYRYMAHLSRLAVPIVGEAGAGYRMRKFPRRPDEKATYPDVSSDGAGLSP